MPNPEHTIPSRNSSKTNTPEHIPAITLFLAMDPMIEAHSSPISSSESVDYETLSRSVSKKGFGLRSISNLKWLWGRVTVGAKEWEKSCEKYIVRQGTEQSDLAIILRDLQDGRLAKDENGTTLAPYWALFLFGSTFTKSSPSRVDHVLLYTRVRCTCLICLIRKKRAEVEKKQNQDFTPTITVPSPKAAMDGLTGKPSVTHESIKANFSFSYALPAPNELEKIGGQRTEAQLEIGELVRLQSRNTARLVFNEEVRLLFGHFAFTGPMTHEMLYRTVTTIGVNYYLYNKGKRNRTVYLRGELVQLPVDIGLLRNPAQPIYLQEIGSTFIIYRPQIMQIYIGEIVLEGNAVGSEISTGITFYLGFGEKDGAVALFPDNRPIASARRLGINELLLHHHQVGDIEALIR